MLYSFVTDSFKQRNFVADFLQANAILDRKRPFCVFEPSFGGLGATYDDHLRLIRKCVVDFLLLLIELFLARCHSRGATSEHQFEICDFVPTGAG